MWVIIESEDDLRKLIQVPHLDIVHVRGCKTIGQYRSYVFNGRYDKDENGTERPVFEEFPSDK